jgi:hypothetical protein
MADSVRPSIAHHHTLWLYKAQPIPFGSQPAPDFSELTLPSLRYHDNLNITQYYLRECPASRNADGLAVRLAHEIRVVCVFTASIAQLWVQKEK